MIQAVKIHGIDSDLFRQLVEDMDSIRRDNQRIASALEELCANNKAS